MIVVAAPLESVRVRYHVERVAVLEAARDAPEVIGVALQANEGPHRRARRNNVAFPGTTCSRPNKYLVIPVSVHDAGKPVIRASPEVNIGSIRF